MKDVTWCSVHARLTLLFVSVMYSSLHTIATPSYPYYAHSLLFLCLGGPSSPFRCNILTILVEPPPSSNDYHLFTNVMWWCGWACLFRMFHFINIRFMLTNHFRKFGYPVMWYMGVFGFEVCSTWGLRYSSSKFSSPAGVTSAGFRLIRPVVCLISEFKDCNLA